MAADEEIEVGRYSSDNIPRIGEALRLMRLEGDFYWRVKDVCHVAGNGQTWNSAYLLVEPGELVDISEPEPPVDVAAIFAKAKSGPIQGKSDNFHY